MMKAFHLQKYLMIDQENCNVNLFVYGVLMCNPTKIKYNDRIMDKKFYCFGDVFDVGLSAEGGVSSLTFPPCDEGFAATAGSTSVRIVLNEKFQSILEEKGLESRRYRGPSPPRELCFTQKETLLSLDELKGELLTDGEDGTLYKWKTSQEDESNSFELLFSILK
jgi:hypothetical protein